MGTFSCPIEIISADGARSETVDALVDTGSTYTCVPAILLHELGVVPYRRIQSELADGSVVDDEIGEARIRIEGVETTTIVVFVGEGAPALLGAYALEGALLAVDPVRQRLAPTHALRMGSQSPLR
jgi:clan AA aspartic protease